MDVVAAGAAAGAGGVALGAPHAPVSHPDAGTRQRVARPARALGPQIGHRVEGPALLAADGAAVGYERGGPDLRAAPGGLRVRLAGGAPPASALVVEARHGVDLHLGPEQAGRGSGFGAVLNPGESPDGAGADVPVVGAVALGTGDEGERHPLPGPVAGGGRVAARRGARGQRREVHPGGLRHVPDPGAGDPQPGCRAGGVVGHRHSGGPDARQDGDGREHASEHSHRLSLLTWPTVARPPDAL